MVLLFLLRLLYKIALEVLTPRNGLEHQNEAAWIIVRNGEERFWLIFDWETLFLVFPNDWKERNCGNEVFTLLDGASTKSVCRRRLFAIFYRIVLLVLFVSTCFLLWKVACQKEATYCGMCWFWYLIFLIFMLVFGTKISFAHDPFDDLHLYIMDYQVFEA